jgi:hypothetical protein
MSAGQTTKQVIRRAVAMSTVLLITLYVAVALTSNPTIVPTSADAANQAIDLLQKWATWMATILTGALAGLVAFVSSNKAQRYDNKDLTILTFAVICVGVALLLCAWIQSALPSMALRVGEFTEDPVARSSQFDVYGHPLYKWMETHTVWGWKGVSLSYVLTIQHWTWVLALIAIGTHIIRGLGKASGSAGR